MNTISVQLAILQACKELKQQLHGIWLALAQRTLEYYCHGMEGERYENLFLISEVINDRPASGQPIDTQHRRAQ